MGKPAADPALLPFRRERILAVGVLAALGPVPLAFGDTLAPAVLALYLLAVGLLLAAVRSGRIPCLADRWLNLAGLAFLFLFWFGLRFGGRSLLKTALHILLFTTVLKLASIKRERDFSVAMTLGVFLLVASMATSTHSTILLFLALYAAIAWPLMSRWALWRDLAAAPEEWNRDERAREIPSRRAVAASLAAAFAVGLPMFVLLPRLKQSYLRGLPGRDTGESAFSDTVDTNLWGRLRLSDKVFLRVSVEDGPVDEAARFLRIRLVAHTRFDRGVWRKPPADGRVFALREEAPLALHASGGPAARPVNRVSLEIAPLGTKFLPYPVTGISASASPELLRRFGAVPVLRDRDANLHLLVDPPSLMRVEVLSAAEPGLDLAPPAADDPSRRAPGSPVLLAFGRDAAPGIDPAASPFVFATKLEEHLSTRFFYTDESARWGPSPVEEFLTKRKSGHCETFATAMALVLRENGIPSRLVTGFAGGERGPFGGYYLVRGRDAHAWVEAWCGPTLGWVAFDPTPESGRPGVTRANLVQSARQFFENLEFLYGRYVLGFAQADQANLARIVQEATESAAKTVRDVARALRAAGGSPATARLALVLLACLAALAAALLLRRFRGPAGFGTRGLPPASAAYRRLQRALRRRGADLTPASAPAETLASADRCGFGAPSREIVRAYVAESFGGRETPPAEAERLAALLRELRGRRPAG
jgi:hypothetical protein